MLDQNTQKLIFAEISKRDNARAASYEMFGNLCRADSHTYSG